MSSNQYMRELAGYLALVEGKHPFTRFDGGASLLAERIETLYEEKDRLAGAGRSRDCAACQAVCDLIKLLEGQLEG